MEGVYRETSFSVGMAQLDGCRNRGVVGQRGEIWALMTWKEEKEYDVCNGLQLHYIAIIIPDSEFLVSPSQRRTQKTLQKTLPCLSTFTYFGYRQSGPCFSFIFSDTLTTVML